MKTKILAILILFNYYNSFAHNQLKLFPDSLFHKNKGEKIYLKSEVDSVAKYQPNDLAMFSYFARNLEYPLNARESGIQGVVYASFIVEKNGSISDIIIIKSLSKSCDKEVKRIILSLPNKWKPALKDGQIVRFQYILPFSFKIPNDNIEK